MNKISPSFFSTLTSRNIAESSAIKYPPALRSQDRYIPPSSQRLAREPASRYSNLSICRELFPNDMNQGEVTLVGTGIHVPVYIPRGEMDYLHILLFSRECRINLVEIGQYQNRRPILIRREDLLRLIRGNQNSALGLRFDFPQGIELR